MHKNFTPTFVYQRKRQRNNSIGTLQPHPPANCSGRPLTAVHERVVSGEEASFEEGLTSDLARTLNVCNANDNSSSSKSNLGLSSGGECSSSGALVSENVQGKISARDVCISILRSQGLLDVVSTESNDSSDNNYCLMSCKVCERTRSTKNLLICDGCEDAFHVSCYNPRIKIIPVGEWLCGSCLKKRHKILKDKSTSNAVNNNSESGRRRYLDSELDLGSLGFMFRDTEPYMSNVRIGNEFQADVPVWHGPVYKECDLAGDPLETDHFNYINTQEKDSIKPLKLSSIGNWLQCRELIGEGGDGTVCGKWRRAPLFEVQTDNWNCFCCVLWDPPHADCAVPQEIETEEVMKQLKYIEMLRPRLAAKKRKLDGSKSNGSRHP